MYKIDRKKGQGSVVCSYAYRGLLRARRGEESMYVLSRMRRRGREESEKDKQSPLGRACDGQRAQTMRVKGATSLATFLAGRSLFFEDFVPLPWTHGKFFSPSEEVDQTVMSITTFGKKDCSIVFFILLSRYCTDASYNCSFRSCEYFDRSPIRARYFQFFFAHMNSINLLASVSSIITTGTYFVA